ncbi:hypothetical protein VZT92_002307 [Zoarces viviparus]|uniref:Uncharacterized protein n=1 Tax=Zoarces viviparus TaxID=48416 RepID=A0AAW1FZN8_ZOAVI
MVGRKGVRSQDPKGTSASGAQFTGPDSVLKLGLAPSERAGPSGFSGSRVGGWGGLCAHHHWSLRLVDFTATLVWRSRKREERSRLLPAGEAADGRVSDACARGG